jgi:hypothetical protein
LDARGGQHFGVQSEPAVGATISVANPDLSGVALDESATLVADSDLALVKPSDITVNATSPTGAVVNYTNPTATDEDLSTVTVGCSPASTITPAAGSAQGCRDNPSEQRHAPS